MKICMLAACILLASTGLSAQETSRGEIYGGYSYMNIDTNGLTDRLNANGWEVGGVANINKYVGIEGNVAGYYNTTSVAGIDINSRAYSYTGGPHFHIKPVFVHALFGGDHLTGSALGVSGSQNGFAMALGGGIEFPASNGFGVRAAVDYALSHHNVVGGTRVDQNNVRVGLGILYSFGGRSRSDGGLTTATDAKRPFNSIPELGISGRETQSGFWITHLTPSSPLAGTGVTENDLIIAVNGNTVSSAAQISASLPPSGDVTITVMLSRMARKDFRVSMHGK